MKFFAVFPTMLATTLATQLLSAQSTSTIIQGDSCYFTKCYVERCACETKHPIFNYPKEGKPVEVASLGHAPQFGTLKNFSTSEEVYAYLKQVYKDNQNNNAPELDALWNAMGFQGFNDADFTASNLELVYYSGGISGMLGGSGHKYVYANIGSGKSAMLKGYKVKAKGQSCDITIMETCGNAFFAGCGENCSTTVLPIDLPSWAKTGNVIRFGFSKDDIPYLRVCDAATPVNLHSIYNLPEDTAPKKINTLSPQFGSLKHLNTPEQVFDHLKKLYFDEKNGQAAELDRLWTAMGFHGFNDHRFTIECIRIMNYEGGMTGMAGIGNQKYDYIQLPASPVRGFQIRALSNCDITLLDNGGNAFFSGCSVTNCEEYPVNQKYRPTLSPDIKYGNHTIDTRSNGAPGFLQGLK